MLLFIVASVTVKLGTAFVDVKYRVLPCIVPAVPRSIYSWSVSVTILLTGGKELYDCSGFVANSFLITLACEAVIAVSTNVSADVAILPNVVDLTSPVLTCSNNMKSSATATVGSAPNLMKLLPPV